MPAASLHGSPIPPPPATRTVPEPSPLAAPAPAPIASGAPFSPYPNPTDVPVTSMAGLDSMAPQPAAMTSGWTDPAALVAKPKRRVPKAALIAVIAVVVLGALGGGGYWYLWHWQPKQALLGYLGRVAGAKTATYSGNLSFDDSGSGSDTNLFSALDKFSLSLNGAYDIKDTNNPKIKLDVTGKFGTTSVGGDALVVDKTLFFKISSLGLLDTLGVQISNDWYKVPLDQELSSNACYNQTKSGSGNILGQRVLTQLPVKDTKRAGLFQTVDGHRGTDYTGSVDFTKIQAYVDAANKQLPAQCKLTYNASDFKGISLSYEVFTATDFDRINLKATDASDSTSTSTTNITIDTSKYNQPVNITAPTNAKDISDLLSQFDGADSSGSDSFASTDSATTNAPDAQRKSDVRAVKNALETYYNDNGYYPPGNYAGLSIYLVTAYIPSMPVDPGGGSYTYAPSPAGCKLKKCSSYTITATLDNKSDSEATNGVYSVSSVNSSITPSSST